LITEIERAHSENKRDLCKINVRMVCNQIAPKVIQKINIRMVCNQIAPKVIQINVGPRLTTVSKTNTFFRFFSKPCGELFSVFLSYFALKGDNCFC